MRLVSGGARKLLLGVPVIKDNKSKAYYRDNSKIYQAKNLPCHINSQKY